MVRSSWPRRFNNGCRRWTSERYTSPREALGKMVTRRASTVVCETSCFHWRSSTACVTHEPIARRGEKTTTVTARTVRLAAYPQTRSRNAVLIPLRSLREFRSISTATLPLLPNPYSHNTWIKNGGIPDWQRPQMEPRSETALSLNFIQKSTSEMHGIRRGHAS